MADAGTTTNLVQALGPAFAAGFAVQRLLEVLDPAINPIFGGDVNDTKPGDRVLLGFLTKRLALGIASFAIGLWLAFGAGMKVLGPLGLYSLSAPPFHLWLADGFVTALVISGGTEGFNSIMKFLGYAKDQKQADKTVAQATLVAVAPPTQ